MEAPTMEYLVTMTTHVPDGTPDETVQAIRTREAERSRELAAQGHLLRLWRPPVQPGEWRTLGLFAAADGGQLEEVLTSMPLRVWRTDEVAPLAPHPNDPGDPDHPRTETRERAMEFLITLTITVPDGTAVQTVTDTTAREAVRARELAEQGHLVRLWSLPAQPGRWRTLGLWRAHDPAEMHSIMESLPLYAWMTVGTTPLSQHPNDPAITGRMTAGA
jgi:muconolactone delta-isomerase